MNSNAWPEHFAAQETGNPALIRDTDNAAEKAEVLAELWADIGGGIRNGVALTAALLPSRRIDMASTALAAPLGAACPDPRCDSDPMDWLIVAVLVGGFVFSLWFWWRSRRR